MSQEIPNHEETYSYSSVKNIIHRYRLRTLRQVCSKTFTKNLSYADFGCSNGYVTNIIANDNKFNSIHGYDFIPELINEGKKRFNFNIHHLDLNMGISPGKYDNVSCFETLEHTVNLNNSLKVILSSINKNGVGIISVPIEVGVVGILKFFAKTIFFKYSLDEISSKNIYFKYLYSLIKNERISKYRNNKNKKEWSSHFGFDYRDVVDYMKNNLVNYKMKIKGTTAIFIIFK